MSVHAISWVLKHSKARLADRLVLIVLADHASSDGTNSYPSVETIAHEARISERGARYALRRLEESGQITRVGRSEFRTFNYSIRMEGAHSAPSRDLPPNRPLANAHSSTSYLRSVKANGLGADSDQASSEADLDWFDRERLEGGAA